MIDIHCCMPWESNTNMHKLAKKNELMKINRRRSPSSEVSQKKRMMVT